MVNEQTETLCETQRPVAGFWRRVIAALIDGLILGLVGWILGFFLSDFFMSLGGWGRLLGYAIALAYFVPGNSSIFSGQTVGKRALGIRVVKASGETLAMGNHFYG